MKTNKRQFFKLLRKAAIPPTPELDKMHTVKEKSQAIGEFLEWLNERGIHLCKWRDKGDNGQPRFVWKDGVKIAKKDKCPVSEREPDHIDEWNNDAKRNPEYESWPGGYVADHTSIEKRLAEYFGIDLNKCEKERRAILEHIRS